MKSYFIDVLKIVLYCFGFVCLAGVLLVVVIGYFETGKFIFGIEDINILLYYWYMLSLCGTIAYTGIYIADIVYKNMYK